MTMKRTMTIIKSMLRCSEPALRQRQRKIQRQRQEQSVSCSMLRCSEPALSSIFDFLCSLLSPPCSPLRWSLMQRLIMLTQHLVFVCAQNFHPLKVMEDGVAFLESSGVLNQVRELGIATTHWEEAVLAFRFTIHHQNQNLLLVFSTQRGSGTV